MARARRLPARLPDTVAVVLPGNVVPGLQRLGTYAVDQVHHVTPDIAVRLRARGFQLAPAGGDTALPPPADAAGRGTFTQAEE